MGKIKTVNDIDWVGWQPVDRATLLFVICRGRMLLIHKKRGLGAGKINGPGGRLEPGETPEQCAVREVHEEVCITPRQVSFCGTLAFQFTNGYSIHGTVFRAADYRGEPCETDEAHPLWFPLDAIPYEQMWADDIHWMPLMLRYRPFSGRFIFDGDTMLDLAINITIRHRTLDARSS